jgi:hypothetical protein
VIYHASGRAIGIDNRGERAQGQPTGSEQSVWHRARRESEEWRSHRLLMHYIFYVYNIHTSCTDIPTNTICFRGKTAQDTECIWTRSADFCVDLARPNTITADHPYLGSIGSLGAHCAINEGACRGTAPHVLVGAASCVPARGPGALWR